MLWVKQDAMPGTIVAGDTECLLHVTPKGTVFEGYASIDGIWWLLKYKNIRDYDNNTNSIDLGCGVELSLSAAKQIIKKLVDANS